ncbi:MULTISPECIES: TetR family transcriptional regulator [unclassified Streptomyces]|uniref:TetR/AcrR family transcriptional regulator n=1 Tax=unclassified Streptomyces TaxID=2593676 RepID=UPI003443E0CD
MMEPDPPEPTFVRARRPEHKEQRREAILTAARELATASGVRNVSLGNVATAVGLAKSNVVRYFGTREEIFLVLAVDAWHHWAEDVLARLHDGENPIDALAEPLASRPLFCDLLSQLGATLEHNVSVSAARDFKQAVNDINRELAEAIADALPTLTVGEARELAAQAPMLAGTYYPAANPPPTLTQLYAETPELAADCPVLLPSLKRTLAAVASGLPCLRP